MSAYRTWSPDYIMTPLEPWPAAFDYKYRYRGQAGAHCANHQGENMRSIYQPGAHVMLVLHSQHNEDPDTNSYRLVMKRWCFDTKLWLGARLDLEAGTTYKRRGNLVLVQAQYKHHRGPRAFDLTDLRLWLSVTHVGPQPQLEQSLTDCRN